MAFQKYQPQHNLKFYSLPEASTINQLIKIKFFDSHCDWYQFDPQFFFICMQNFEKFSEKTAKIYLNHLISFIKSHFDDFCKKVLPEAKYDLQVQPFLYSISQKCIDSKDQTIINQCHVVIVEIVKYFFLKKHESN